MAPSTSNELYNFVANEGHGVKGLAETGLKTLPKEYIQPLAERLNKIEIVTDVSIPVIDMSNFDSDPKVAESICDAAEKWGFFQIVNHAVPIEVLESVKEAT